MKIYLDLFFVFNVIMDTIIIMGVSYLLKRKTSFGKIILSSLLGGISSLLLFININKIIIEIFSIIIMSIISFGYKNIKYTIHNILYMYLVSIILGGLIYLFNIKVDNSFFFYLIVIVISGEVTLLYVKEMHEIKNIYHNYYPIDIYFLDNKLSLMGFIDTGNNLYDPYKHRPIIIIPSKYLKDDKYLLVPYHTAAGDSLLKCIVPKYIIFNNRKITKVLIGYSDNIKCIEGAEVLLHKDLLKGDKNV